MVTHVGARGRSRDRHCRTEADLITVLLGSTITEVRISYCQRRDPERRCLALLPRQVFSMCQIEGNADDMEGLVLRQFGHFPVVALVEAGEGVGPAPLIRGPEVAPDQPVPVIGVKRELVDIDDKGGDDRPGYEDGGRY